MYIVEIFTLHAYLDASLPYQIQMSRIPHLSCFFFCSYLRRFSLSPLRSSATHTLCAQAVCDPCSMERLLISGGDSKRHRVCYPCLKLHLAAGWTREQPVGTSTIYSKKHMCSLTWSQFPRCSLRQAAPCFPATPSLAPLKSVRSSGSWAKDVLRGKGLNRRQGERLLTHTLKTWRQMRSRIPNRRLVEDDLTR